MKRSDLKALVLEDEKNFSRVIAMTLKHAGISNIDIASKEEDAMAVASKGHELLILDTMYGTRDPYGPRVLSKLREIGNNPKLVIASSCDYNSESLWKGTSKVDHFLKKPYSLRSLAGIITKRFPEA